MPVRYLVRLGWLVDPPEPYRGAVVEIFHTQDDEVWVLRVSRGADAPEEHCFSGPDELACHLGLDAENPDLQVSFVPPRAAVM